MEHTLQGRGHDIRTLKVELIAELVEQTQRMGLVIHARPVVEQLVAAAPHDDRRMTAQFLDGGSCFLLENIEVVRCADIVVAGEDKFLPDHDTHLVAVFVECLFLEAGTAPQTEDVHVGFLCRDQLLIVALVGDASEEQLRIDPVGALCKNAAAVEFNGDRHGIATLGEASRLVVGTAAVHDELDGTEADFAGIFVFRVLCGVGVEVRLALSVAPPELDIFNDAGGLVACIDDIAVGVTDGIGHGQIAVGLKAEDSGRAGGIERVERLAVADIALRSRLDVARLPDTGDDETRVPVPLIGGRRLAGLRCHLTGRCELAGELGMRMDTDNEVRAGMRDVGQVNFGHRVHTLVGVHALAVDDDVEDVVDTLCDKDGALTVLDLVVERGFVLPEVVFHFKEALCRGRVHQRVGDALRDRKVILQVAGDFCRERLDDVVCVRGRKKRALPGLVEFHGGSPLYGFCLDVPDRCS